MTKTEIKHAAQDAILHAMVSAFYAVGDDKSLDISDRSAVLEELEVQMQRVEKLFGIVPGTSLRA